MKHFNNCLEEYNSLIKNLQNQYNTFKNISLETEKVVHLYSIHYVSKNTQIQFDC